MNWSRTKTWLIVLFIGINLFLIFTIAKENIAQSTISEQTIEDTVAILARNDISLQPESIPRKMPTLSAVEVQNSIKDQKEFAKLLLGEDAKYDAESEQYMRGTSILRFDGDTFSYLNINPALQNAYTDTANAVEYAKNFFKKLNFDMTKAQVQILQHTTNETKIRFTQKLDSYPLLDSQIEITVTSKGVTSADGCWFYMSDKQSGTSAAGGRVKEITSVLVDFISDPYRAGSSTKITQITLGYTTGNKSNFHKAVSAMPSWRITTADGRTYYYDAH